MIRVLHVIGAMDRAGAETLLMNLYRNIDRSKVQFDFLVHTDERCAYDDEIEALGGKIYHIPRYNVLNAKTYRKTIREFLEAHPEHVVVHGHIGSSAPIYIDEAAKLGKYTIAHSHNNASSLNPGEIAFKLISSPVRGKADYYMACSQEAGLDRFGKKIVNSKDFSILNNGIIVDEFKRDAGLAKAAKASLELGDAPIFGHIGRLTAQKNQSFLIDVFAKTKEQLPDAKLLLIGKGKDEKKLKTKAAQLGLADSILFLGVREDIPNLLRAIDVFVFPSIYEGLGVSVIEAQAAGLQCVVSNEIHDIAMLSDRVVRLSLGDVDKWADECIKAYVRSKTTKDSQENQIASAGFDISDTAQWLQDFYLGHA